MNADPCPIGADIEAILSRLVERMAEESDPCAAELGAAVLAGRRRQESGPAEPEAEQPPPAPPQ